MQWNIWLIQSIIKVRFDRYIIRKLGTKMKNKRNYNSRHGVLSWGHRGHLVTSINKDGRQQNPHDSGQHRLFLTLICKNHPQFASWEEKFLVFVTTIKIRNLLTTWALTSCDLTIFFHRHKYKGLLLLADENKYINNMLLVLLLILIKRWYFQTRLVDHKNTYDSGQQTFLDFDLQKRLFL